MGGPIEAYAGVVYQDINAAIAGESPLDQRGARAFVAEVAGSDKRLASTDGFEPRLGARGQ